MGTEQVERYIAAHKKSHIVGLFLALVVGPLGLFYPSIAAGVIMTLAAVGLGMVAGSFGVVVAWVLSLVMAPVLVAAYNAKVVTQAELIASASGL